MSELRCDRDSCSSSRSSGISSDGSSRNSSATNVKEAFSSLGFSSFRPCFSSDLLRISAIMSPRLTSLATVSDWLDSGASPGQGLRRLFLSSLFHSSSDVGRGPKSFFWGAKSKYHYIRYLIRFGVDFGTETISVSSAMSIASSSAGMI